MPLFSEGNGVWSRDVTVAAPGQPYKFVLNGNLWRRDPYSRQIEATGTRNSIIHNPSTFDWGDYVFEMAPPNELVIYEMHIGSYFDPNPNDGQVGKFVDAESRLDHLVNLGINAVELMPISEFPTPTSWGYNLSYPFAIESSYGTPDQLKSFIKACHERGIAVLMDVVHNHWGDDFNDWSLWQYDGWSTGGYGGIYFYSEPNLCCTWWGPRPDYSRPEVREYILNNFRMWKQDYRIDGFRWDAPQFMLFTDNSQAIPIPEASGLIHQVISTLSNEFPRTFHIAEDIKGVVGFNSHWDMGFQGTIQSIMSQGNDNNRNMFTLAGIINNDPNRIIYTESHDTTGNLNAWARRFPNAVSAEDAEGYFARKRSTLASLFSFTSPGTPMLWQGQEMYETNLFSDVRSLDWPRTNSFSHITKFYRDLIHLRRNIEGLTGGLLGPGCGMFLINNTDKVIGYRRYDENRPGEDVVVFANLRNTIRTNYTVQLPHAGTWYVHMNTDDPEYGPDYEGIGQTQVVASGSPPMAQIDIGRYSALVLSQVPVSGVSFVSLSFSDNFYGNADGVLDPGETIFGTLILSNRSPVVDLNVSAHLYSLDTSVQMTQPHIIFAELGSSSVVTGDTRFVVQIPNDWVCGQPLHFDLHVQHGSGSWIMPVELPTGLEFGNGLVTGIWQSVDVPRDIIDNQTIYSDLLINNASLGPIEHIAVWLRINHTWNSDMVIALQHPDGSEVILSNRRGGSGHNFGTGACGVSVVYARFDDDAAIAISAGSSPFAGVYRPDGLLATFNGKHPSGVWRLRVTDVFPADPGELLCWGIEVTALDYQYDCNSFFDTNPDTDGDGIPDWWELNYFGGATNAVAHMDDDGDGYTNWQEFLAGTDPGNPASFLRAYTTPDAAGNVTVQWNSAPGRLYRLWRSPSIDPIDFILIQSNIMATPAMNIFHDTAAEGSPWFYRVELELD